MKKTLLILFCIINSTLFYAQSNDDIAKVYFKRAKEKLFTEINPKKALAQFNKALKYKDSITNYKNAWLGTHIYYELGKLNDAHKYAKQYFLLAKNKNSEEYNTFLELYITIKEEIEEKQVEEKRLEEERIRKELELKKIDSLKTVWHKKSEALSINADSIYQFNKKNIAVFEKSGNFGIIDDKGLVLIKADENNKAVKSFDGFILLLNKKEKPTKILCYNTSTKNSFSLPAVSDFNPLSTHYGKVMLPRGNGRLVTYPNNSLKALVYDLNERKFVNISNLKDLFKILKKADKIDKFNKNGQVKLHKKWYEFGGHIGGGVHPLYNEDYTIYGYLCSIDGTVLKSTDFANLGYFYNEKLQAIKNGETIWLNQNGSSVDAPKDESGIYTGDSKIRKLENGNYQIQQNGVIILGDKKLVKMADFLRQNSTPKAPETSKKE